MEYVNEARRRDEEASNCVKRRVLLVGKDEDLADIFILLLGTANADVRVAYDGKAALEVAAAFKPEVVFLNIEMPAMNGCETARRIRQLSAGRNILLVALTVGGQDQDSRSTSEADFDAHFVKPLEAEQVQALLARHCA